MFKALETALPGGGLSPGPRDPPLGSTQEASTLHPPHGLRPEGGAGEQVKARTLQPSYLICCQVRFPTYKRDVL